MREHEVRAVTTRDLPPAEAAAMFLVSERAIAWRTDNLALVDGPPAE